MNTALTLLVAIPMLVHSKPYHFSDTGMLSRREVGSCGPLQFPATSGLMTTPNFPDNYGDLMDCVYTIEPPGLSNFTVDLYLCECRIEAVSGCQYDWLQLGKGSRHMCGDRTGHTSKVDSADGKVEVTFHSDTNINDLGCSIAYKIGGSEGYIRDHCPTRVRPIKILDVPSEVIPKDVSLDQIPYDLLVRCGLVPPNP